MAKQYETETITVNEVRPGDALAVPDESGRPVLFRVENFGFTHRPPAAVVYTLSSEPLPDTGEPWVLEYPAGAVLTRIIREYDV